MASRSLNKVILIGNLTRDPELRYTPSGTPVCSFGIATNRSWVPSGSEERQEETEFHSVVAWSKLAELCAQLLSKGRKIYIEGRLQTRSWETPEGDKRMKTEIVAEDMIILDNKKGVADDESKEESTSPKASVAEPKNIAPTEDSVFAETPEPEKPSQPVGDANDSDSKPAEDENIDLTNIPF